jgi:LacI family transcriptional regulator
MIFNNAYWRTIMRKKNAASPREAQTVTLRTVAEYVGLAPCSVSAVLNNSAAGMSIPQPTRDRVWRAARRLNYRPNYSARALRTRRTYTVAMLMPDIGYAPAARIAAGAEDFLREHDYCLIIATYDGAADWQQNQLAQLRQRGVEGVIALQAERLCQLVFLRLQLMRFQPMPSNHSRQLRGRY